MTGPEIHRNDWRVREGQAAWRPAADRPELTGELTVAVQPGGDALVQFLKTPFPVVTARTTGNRWQIDFHSERTFSGQGAPPPDFIWLHLPQILAGAPPPKGWTQEVLPERRWRLVNPNTGETLEGYLHP